MRGLYALVTEPEGDHGRVNPVHIVDDDRFEIVSVGKNSQLPLPMDVGKTVADYLQNGRPLKAYGWRFAS